MTLLNSNYDDERNLLGKLWDNALYLSALFMYPIILSFDCLYPDDEIINHGNSIIPHPMRVTVRGVVGMAIIFLIGGVPCSAFALATLVISAALSIPAILADSAVDAGKFWNKRYKETCKTIFSAALHIALMPFHCLKQVTSKPLAVIASIPFTLGLLPLSLIVAVGGAVTTVATGIASGAESIFRKVFCLSRGENNSAKTRTNETSARVEITYTSSSASPPSSPRSGKTVSFESRTSPLRSSSTFRSSVNSNAISNAGAQVREREDTSPLRRRSCF